MEILIDTEDNNLEPATMPEKTTTSEAGLK
jgi:hypothetical protein